MGRMDQAHQERKPGPAANGDGWTGENLSGKQLRAPGDGRHTRHCPGFDRAIESMSISCAFTGPPDAEGPISLGFGFGFFWILGLGFGIWDFFVIDDSPHPALECDPAKAFLPVTGLP